MVTMSSPISGSMTVARACQTAPASIDGATAVGVPGSDASSSSAAARRNASHGEFIVDLLVLRADHPELFQLVAADGTPGRGAPWWLFLSAVCRVRRTRCEYCGLGFCTAVMEITRRRTAPASSPF